MALKPWYTIIQPRDDLRSGKPLDAAEFAVHLDRVRDGSAPPVYIDPAQFFERTFLTKTLLNLAADVVRRLAGETTGASAVFNLSTQFGGGKTHALTLLYHLARHGHAAEQWAGVPRIREQAGIAAIPAAAVAVFVGTEFDSIRGRGGDDGTPLRRTPWGEIAYQLGGAAALEMLARHDAEFIEPKGDVIRAMLPQDRPSLILMDEIISYVSTYRREGYGNALYNFIQALSETARSEPNVVLVISIPTSEIEFTESDSADEQRFKKMLDRLGKAYMLSAETETAEIIRRRLFEWDLRAIGQNGRVLLPRDATETCAAYAHWIQAHRQSLPQTFAIDSARDAFTDTYPFHPMLLTVFERKWQSLPRFQQTRGVLRLLAQWVARAYREGYTMRLNDPLIDLGTAPLDDPLFRSAVFEQLGENKLEIPVTTDICGQKNAHATRLDEEASDTIRTARLHRKVATAIFFESNGGQAQTYASQPEIRLSVAAPDLDIANVETVIEALVPPNGVCYYLDTERNRYWFSIKPNLIKILADRKGSVQRSRIEERVRAEIERVFSPLTGIERIFFPLTSGHIPNQPLITLVIMAPDQPPDDPTTLGQIESFIRESGGSGRTFKSALIFVLATGAPAIEEEARKLLAWELINDEKDALGLDGSQRMQAEKNVGDARRNLCEAVWRGYHHIALLGKDNTVSIRDLGLIHSSAATSPTALIINRLKLDGDIEETIGPNFLVRNWPAMAEWSTKAVRDAFFASPRFPRLLNASTIRETIAKGVANKFLAYVSKADDGAYQPFIYGQHLGTADIEITDDTYIIVRETAEAYLARPPAVENRQAHEKTTPEDERDTGGGSDHQSERRIVRIVITPSDITLKPGETQMLTAQGYTDQGQTMSLPGVTWFASAGTIDAMGMLTAGAESGSITVTATSGEISEAVTVTVLPPPQRGVKHATWQGDIPTQKWMTFYTRVLSRFAAGTGIGMRLTVQVDLTTEQEISPQQIEDMQAGLRDMGLSDDIETA